MRFWRLMLVGGFLRVCPIHLHFCFVISSFTSSSPVLCQRSLLLMVSGQKILDIFQRQQLNIRVNNEILEQVDTFKYLGIQIKNDLRTDKELETRGNLAKSKLSSMHKILKSKRLKMSTRIKILKCYVFSIFCYGCEAWTLNKVLERKIEVFEMWCLRKMGKFKW